MTRAMVAVWMLALLGCADDTPGVDPSDAGTSLMDARCDVQGTCNADFPCGGRRFVCLSETWWRRVSTRDCSFRCGCVPCTGQSCEPEGPQLICPEGTVCTRAELRGGMIDTRPTPCAPPVPEEDVAVRTARVRAQLVGSWSAYRSQPRGEDTFFTLDLREDGSVLLGCRFANVPCTPFGFANTHTSAGHAWTLDEVNAMSIGRGLLRLATATGTLRTVSLENMVFLPNTEAISSFVVSLPRDDAGVSEQYTFARVR